jgi:hypothetical protein
MSLTEEYSSDYSSIFSCLAHCNFTLSFRTQNFVWSNLYNLNGKWSIQRTDSKIQKSHETDSGLKLFPPEDERSGGMLTASWELLLRKFLIRFSPACSLYSVKLFPFAFLTASCYAKWTNFVMREAEESLFHNKAVVLCETCFSRRWENWFPANRSLGYVEGNLSKFLT